MATENPLDSRFTVSNNMAPVVKHSLGGNCCEQCLEMRRVLDALGQ